MSAAEGNKDNLGIESQASWEKFCNEISLETNHTKSWRKIKIFLKPKGQLDYPALRLGPKTAKTNAPVERNFGIQSDNFDSNQFNEVNQFIQGDYEYFYPHPEYYRMDMDDDHDLVADIDSDTLIRIVKFLKGGKAPDPDNIHNEALRLAITSLFHHLGRLFYLPIQIGYIPTVWKLATLRMLLKPDKLPSLTTSYIGISAL